jgi:hypothetical protein
MPKAASSVHDRVTSSIHFDLPETASDDDRATVARILSKCVEEAPPSDPLASAVVGPCWALTGSRAGNGYGRVWLGSKKRDAATHRVLLAIVRDFDRSLDVDHLCRNRACCNPDHLEPVTRSQNLRRGKGAKHARLGKCAHCGSLDGEMRPRGRSWKWRCVPCTSAYNQLPKTKARYAARDAKRREERARKDGDA